MSESVARHQRVIGIELVIDARPESGPAIGYRKRLAQRSVNSGVPRVRNDGIDYCLVVDITFVKINEEGCFFL